MRKRLLWILCAMPLAAQGQATNELWNLYFQATSIGQYHPEFNAPYSGDLSLVSHREAEASLTTTLYLGIRLGHNTQLYVNPEVAGGRAFSATTGMSNFPNGEMPRVSTATPKPYLARLYVTHDFAFGEAREAVASDANQLGGTRPAVRYSVTVGRFTVTDFFDLNRYSHDPREQFMGWAIMYNGAWDYPADTRGYTWGWMHEFHTPRWAVRYASVAEPRVANGLRFDRHILRDRGDVVEGELDVKPHGHEATIRAMAYINHADAGTYADAIALANRTGTTPDITATSRIGTRKYGFGTSIDQEVADGVGVFGRLGWNDGKTQSFAFTAIDRLATIGTSVSGSHWRRKNDTAATELTVCGLSGVHADYLARGGLDFIIGDGRLNRGNEIVWESYYSAPVNRNLTLSLDAQRVVNPAFNRDRGPLWVASLRVHVEFGTK